MNLRKFICGASFHQSVLVIVFASLVYRAVAEDAQHEACAPQNCGNGLNITYPFWISGVQESYCGYPNFEITCVGMYPVLNFSDSEFIVKDIFYANHSFLLVNALEYEDSCGAPPHNISLERTPFNLSSTNVDFFFYYNCTSQSTGFTYPVDCASNYSQYSFALFPEKAFLESDSYSAISSCDSPVSVPVDVNANTSSLMAMNYSEIMKMGFLLNWTAIDCSNCEGSEGRCGIENNNFVCFCPDGPHSQTCNDGKRGILGTKAIIGIAASGVGIGIAIILMLSFRKEPMIRRIMALIKQRSEHFDGEMRIEGLISSQRYTYKDIKRMTDSFKEKLGQGGYGYVFKGKLQDGQLVAVKLLKKLKGDAEEFFNEVASISRTSHVNVVKLLGFCFEGSKRALVYEFMPNGSLEKFIVSRSNTLELDQLLSWDTLYQISLGIAHGLEYLHKGCNTRILHFDIKPHNILLDTNYCPKISDFGLAKICPRQESIVSMLGARGTPGYIAPELFIRNIGGVSHKSDVYSYGMMVLEMVGKRKNIEVTADHSSETYFPDWFHQCLELREELGLHGITNEQDEVIAKKMIIIGLWCIQINPRARPCMTQVVEMLKGSFEALQIPPKPSLSSPSRSLAACPCEISSLQESNDSSWGYSISII